MDVRVKWVENSAFLGLSESGHWVPMDTPHDSADGAPTPMEHLLLALGGCMGITVRALLVKMRQEFTALEVTVHGDRAEEHPKAFTAIRVKLAVTGRALERASVEKAVTLTHDKYCSVGAMLSKACPITTEVDLLEG